MKSGTIILAGIGVLLTAKIATDKRFAKEFVHNVIVHPAMMLLPLHVANELHDRNANWAFGSERFDEISLESGL